MCGKQAGWRGWTSGTSGVVEDRAATAPYCRLGPFCRPRRNPSGACTLTQAADSTVTPAVAEMWPGKAYPLGATYDGSGTNFAVFSEVAEKVELCLFDADGTEIQGDAARGRRLRLARLHPQHRARPALRLPRARPLRSGRRTTVQPEQAAARPVRQGHRRHLRVEPVAVRLQLRRSRQPQRRRLGGQHAQVGGDQPVLRLGRRPPAAATSTPTPSSTRRTSRGSPRRTRTSPSRSAAPTPPSRTR